VTTLRRCAERGANLLDAVQPSWVDLIDVDALKLDDVFNCVLGQLYGHYVEGALSLGVSAELTVYYGFYRRGNRWYLNRFTRRYSRVYREYRMLDDAWRGEVLARLVRRGGRREDVARELVNA
jgi:hypothetical protein